MNSRWIRHACVFVLCLYAAAFLHHVVDDIGHDTDHASHCALCILLIGMPVLVTLLALLTVATRVAHVRQVVSLVRIGRSPQRTAFLRGPPSFV